MELIKTTIEGLVILKPTVFEDERGTYIMNSKDLCMIEHLPELIESGITSLQIEGRMKSSFFVFIGYYFTLILIGDSLLNFFCGDYLCELSGSFLKEFKPTEQIYFRALNAFLYGFRACFGI